MPVNNDHDRHALDDSRISRAESLAREIAQYIRNNSLPDGWRLGTKGELREHFGVAVGTVNQALRLLENRGLIVARPGPGGGLFVATPSSRIRLSHLVLDFGADGGSTAAADCLAVRNELEALVADDARRHHTEQDIAELRELLARMADHSGSARRFLQANWALHRRIAAISPKAVLRGIYGALMDYLENCVEDVIPDALFLGAENLKAHRALVDAIASGDPVQVHNAVKVHTPPTARLSNGHPATD